MGAFIVLVVKGVKMSKLPFICCLSLFMALSAFAQEPMETKVHSFLKHVDDVDRNAGSQKYDQLAQVSMRDELGDPDANDISSTAKLQVKISQLSHEIRRLNGSIEELNHRVKMLEDKSNAPLAAVSSKIDTKHTVIKKDDLAAQAIPQDTSSSGNIVKDAPKTLATLPQDEAKSLDDESKLTEQQRYDRAFSFLTQSKYEEAEGGFRRFLAAYPKSKLAGNAQYWLGESLYVRSKYADAAASFFEGYKKFPDTSKAPDNLLKLGYSLAALGEKKQSCAMLNRLIKQYPETSESLISKAKDQIKKLDCPKN